MEWRTRSVDFGDRLSLLFPRGWKVGETFAALEGQLFGDLDGDGVNEVVISTFAGGIAIYKYTRGRSQSDNHALHPYLYATGLGHVVCIRFLPPRAHISDQSALFVLTRDGFLHLFQVPRKSYATDTEGATARDEHQAPESPVQLSPLDSIWLCANARVCDVTWNDAEKDASLVVGTSDGWVMAFHLRGSMTKALVVEHVSAMDIGAAVTSLRLAKGADGIRRVTVAHDGGQSSLRMNTLPEGGLSWDLPPLPFRQNQAPWILPDERYEHPDIPGEPATPGYVSMAALYPDPPPPGWTTIPSLRASCELSFVTLFDVTGDGAAELVGCFENGETFFVSPSNKSVVLYYQRSTVRAAAVGHFTFGDPDLEMLGMPHSHKTEPCLLYITQEGLAYLYFNLGLSFRPR
mmetsp:Transcript_32669/g.91477  ORF Transcript_32669/g.91477 Transcript_32669/m.91477 type:complete len:405 (-) Transcript_32669:162-1376(-)